MIKYDVANISAAQAVADLGTVADALAQSQPSLIANIMPTILNSAAGVGQTVGNNWGANTTTAAGVGFIVKQAITDIPRDRCGIEVLSMPAKCRLAPTSLLPAFDPLNPGNISKESAFIGATGLVQSVLTSTAANNNIPVIQKALATFTNSYGLSLDAGDHWPEWHRCG